MEYRCSLEVLKFSSFEDVLRQLNSVCRVWARSSSSEELWLSYSEAKQLPSSIYEGVSAKETFRKAVIEEFTTAYFDDSGMTLVDCLSMTIKTKINRWRGNRVGMFAVILPGLRVLSFGGIKENFKRSDWDRAFPVNSAELSTQDSFVSLQGMKTARFRHAGIVFAQELFVFGGIGYSSHLAVKRDLTTIEASEKLNLKGEMQKESWTELPDMLAARRDFTLCIHSNLIWICGRPWSRSCDIETFSPLTSCFREFPCAARVGDCLSATMIGPLLILLQKTTITTIRTDTLAVTTEKVNFAWKDETWPGRADSNVVKVGSTLFSVQRDNVFVLDFLTLQSTYWIQKGRDVRSK